MIKLNYLLIESNIDLVKKLVNSDKLYDIQFNGNPSKSGWKLSIQGKTINDVFNLIDRLHSWLTIKNIAHKFGTLKRLNQQSHKLCTIYVPDDMDYKKLALQIEYLLNGYKGWHNIKTPESYEHYSNGIFIRNDRNEYGDYKKAQK